MQGKYTVLRIVYKSSHAKVYDHQLITGKMGIIFMARSTCELGEESKSKLPSQNGLHFLTLAFLWKCLTSIGAIKRSKPKA